MTRADTQVRPLQLTHQFSGRHFFLCHLFTALGLPALAQGMSVERVPSPVAQVLDLMLDQRGDQSIRLGASHSVRQIFQLFNRKKATDARADVATLDDGGTLGERFVCAVEIKRQNADARMQRKVTNDRLEVSYLARQRTRAFGENERVVPAFEIVSRVPQLLA